jgi:hypothetical protein
MPFARGQGTQAGSTPFATEALHHNRTAVTGSSYRYFASLIELATWAEFLIAAARATTESSLNSVPHSAPDLPCPQRPADLGSVAVLRRFLQAVSVGLLGASSAAEAQPAGNDPEPRPNIRHTCLSIPHKSRQRCLQDHGRKVCGDASPADLSVLERLGQLSQPARHDRHRLRAEAHGRPAEPRPSLVPPDRRPMLARDLSAAA